MPPAAEQWAGDHKDEAKRSGPAPVSSIVHESELVRVERAQRRLAVLALAELAALIAGAVYAIRRGCR